MGVRLSKVDVLIDSLDVLPVENILFSLSICSGCFGRLRQRNIFGVGLDDLTHAIWKKGVEGGRRWGALGGWYRFAWAAFRYFFFPTVLDDYGGTYALYFEVIATNEFLFLFDHDVR